MMDAIRLLCGLALEALYPSQTNCMGCHGPFAAATLKVLILTTALAKVLLHGALRRLTGGRRGRAVPSPRLLSARLKGV